MSGINDYKNNNINNMRNSKIKDNNIRNSKIRESKNKNSEEISFGSSSKEKNYFVNDKSSYIKKDFNKGFLNDPLDEQFSDDEK